MLGGLDVFAQPLLLDRLAGRHSRRRAGRERAEQALVFAVEAGFVAEVVEGGEHADGAAVKRERNEQRGVGLEAEQLLRHVQRRAGVGEPLGALRSQHLAGDGAFDRHLLAVGARGERAGAAGAQVLTCSSRITSVRAPTSARARVTISSRMRLRFVSPPSACAIATAVSSARTVRSRSSRRRSTAVYSRALSSAIAAQSAGITADSSSAAVNGRPPSFSVR